MQFKEIEQMIKECLPEVIDLRRRIHAEPELGNCEVKTAAKVLEKLNRLPLDVRTNIFGNGILATLEGVKQGRTLMFRADMDALPMNEENELDFKSTVPNVMHACGHDMHTAALTGAALVLSRLQSYLKGNVKFMFQPAEESSPVGGSRGMIDAGVLENPKVDEAYGLHVYGIPCGQITFRPGVANSRSDRITIEIIGKSSHGSFPNEGNDAIVAAANVITSIQTIVSRSLSPSERAVITIGTMHGGSRYNVISDKVVLEGTVRSFSDDTVHIIKARLHDIVEQAAATYGCKGVLKYENGYDFMYNDPQLSDFVSKSIGEIIGTENIHIQPNPLPAGEDFSFITKKVPSVFLWVGAESKEHQGKCILHNPEAIFDEQGLYECMRIICKIAYDKLVK